MNYDVNTFSAVSKAFCFLVMLMVLGGCALPDQNSAIVDSAHMQWLSYRVRSDFSAGLNSDYGWAAGENSSAQIYYDQPFRFRVQVMAQISPPDGHQLSLQYRHAGKTWLPVGFAEFPYPGFATPALSVISAEGYESGAETERLLGEPDITWDEGAGLSAVNTTPVWRSNNNTALEWEWPLVVRRFSDGPTFLDNGMVLELRIVDGFGRPLPGSHSAELQLFAQPGHLGGTFVETPGRLGPYQTENGHLYFFMEPSETDNRFMAVKSTDFGQTWKEVDGANRPAADDLEGVASARMGSTVHIIHQVSEEVFYHQFELDGQKSDSGSWRIDSQSIATLEEPPTQFADIVARKDGTVVTAYAGSRRLFLQTRSAQGDWSEPTEIDTNIEPDLSGPVMAVGADDTITIAYTGKDGSGFIRHLHTDGSLSQRHLFSSNLGRTDSENGAIVPLVVIPETGTTVLIYRERDGLLYERRFSRDTQLSEPTQVSQIAVISDAVDSEQVGADLILHNSMLHLLFIDADSRSIFHTYSSSAGVWSEPKLVINNIEAAWVRGSVHLDAIGNPVYGFVFDAGSKGGSGFNRYYVLPL